MINFIVWDILRPDAISVWRDAVVRERLSWYYRVMKDEMPAKFIICKKIPVDDFKNMDVEELWKIHDEKSEIFDELFRAIRNG